MWSKNKMRTEPKLRWECQHERRCRLPAPAAVQAVPEGDFGQSQWGRPKGALGFATIVQRELDAKVSVTANGQKKQISRKEAIPFVEEGVTAD